MILKVKPCGEEYDWKGDVESDLIAITYKNLFDSGGTVCFRLARSSRESGSWIDFVEYSFEAGARFRVLAEIDLSGKYWASGLFIRKFFLYEIEAGGWMDGDDEESQMLAYCKDTGAREWLIATSNFSVTVIASSEPSIHELS